MKITLKCIILAAVLLAAASCRYENEQYNPYTTGAQGFSRSICDYILESSASTLEKLAGDMEIYDDGYHAVVSKDYFSQVEITKLEGVDSTWVVTIAMDGTDDREIYDYYTFNARYLEFTLILTMTGDVEGQDLHTWHATFEGSYDERDGYSATMGSEDSGVDIFWKRTESRTSVQYDMKKYGSCVVEIFEQGKPLDKYSVRYNDAL